MAEGRSLAAYLVMALLSGCAAGGPVPEGTSLALPDRPTLSPEQQARAILPGEPGTGTTLRASDDSTVVATQWGPARPKAVILALHGFGDHGQLTYRGPATAWAAQGIATIAPDQRGFGRNPSRGHWPGADALIADAVAYAAQIRAQLPCTPMTLLGHSMGGGIALGASPQVQADALVLAAPAIWGRGALNPLHRMAAWTAATFVPERRFTGEGVVRIIPSDNDAALYGIWADPHYLAPPSAREIYGLVRITDAAADAAAKSDIPALLLLGEKDQIVPNARVAGVFARTRGPQQVITYPEGWHLLFRDLQAPKVWADVANFALTAPRPKDCK